MYLVNARKRKLVKRGFVWYNFLQFMMGKKAFVQNIVWVL